jgi:8-oxo-dGTP diphosphatase
LSKNTFFTSVGVGGIVLKGSRVLIVFDASVKRWTLPGGHVEKGEGLVSALHRELWEETQVEAAVEKLVALRHTVSSNGVSDLYLVYLMKWLRGEPLPDGSEILEARFDDAERILRDYELSGLTRRLVEKMIAGELLGLSEDKYKPLETPEITNYTLIC